METYHKIQTVFKRDPNTNHKTLLIGDYSEPAFGYLQDNLWAFTEKVDGTNIRVMVTDAGLSIGGKTDSAQLPCDLIENIRAQFTPLVVPLQAEFPNGVCLYGEGYGAGIQKVGRLYGPNKQFVLFDIKVGDNWFSWLDLERLADALGIARVPIVGVGTLHDLVSIVERGFTSRWGDFQAEGIIARPNVELRGQFGQRIITKLKTCDFKTVEKINEPLQVP